LGDGKVRRPALLSAGAVVCLCAAAAAALLSTDVRAWESAFRAGDAEAVAHPALPRQADEILPFHAARSLLGVENDLALRRALVLFHGGYSGIPSRDGSTAGTEARAEAEAALERVVREEPAGRKASIAANLLGVLELVDAATGVGQSGASVEQAIVELQDAIHLDPGNADAKANLELAMSLAPPDSPFRTSRLGSTGKRHGGASESSAGRGY
jgi:hypothetical protein